MLNISKQISAAWNSSSLDLPEATIVPIGASANEKKKLQSITEKFTTVQKYDNIPLPGFTLHKANTRRYGPSDQTWLIIDPRGYFVKISNDNLESILHVTGVTEGLIQERCVWARDNSETKMTLVPVSAEWYVDAVKNTELIEDKVDIKTVQIGDTVLLQNKLQGVYLGVASLYCGLSSYNGTTPTILPRRRIVEVAPNVYYHHTDPKILKIVDEATTALTKDDAIQRINQSISDGNAIFTNSSYIPSTQYSFPNFSYASATTVKEVVMSFEEITKDEAIILFHKSIKTMTPGLLLLERSTDSRHILHFSYDHTQITINNFYVCNVILPSLDHVTRLEFNIPKCVARILSIDEFKKFYKIVKNVKTETYL